MREGGGWMRVYFPSPQNCYISLAPPRPLALHQDASAPSKSAGRSLVTERAAPAPALKQERLQGRPAHEATKKRGTRCCRLKFPMAANWDENHFSSAALRERPTMASPYKYARVQRSRVPFHLRSIDLRADSSGEGEGCIGAVNAGSVLWFLSYEARGG